MKWIFFLLLNLFFVCAYSQSITMKQIDSLDFKSHKYKAFVGVDTQENFFFTKDQEIIKTDLTKQWSYTSFELGFPSGISLLNSLEILVFYEQANTFVMLDRFLNETNRIRLNDLAPPQSAKLLTNAKNNEIWLVDNYENKLKYINYQNNVRSSVSINLSELILDLKANFNNAYLLAENFLYQFDNYGTLLHEIKLRLDEVSKFVLGNRYIILLGKTRNYLYDTNLKKIGSFVLSKNNKVDSYLKDEIFYIFDDGIITKHQLEISKE